MPSHGIARQSWAALADLVLPARCGGCDRAGQRWCRSCAGELARAGPARRWSPTPAPEGLPRVWSVLPYQGAVRMALVNVKDNGRRDLIPVLAPVLTEALLAGLLAGRGGRVVVVPAPSAASNVRRRGDRPLDLLARSALRQLPPGVRPPLVPALRLRRPVADQAGLDSIHRAANLSGAMTISRRSRPQLAGACCVIVDDVITTGATLAEAARVLGQAGADDVLAVTIAATARHTARGSAAESSGESLRHSTQRQ